MANYFYVKSGFGTRAASSDTTFTSKQTGAFSSLTAGDVYASIHAALDAAKTTIPTDGDFIVVSDVHAASFAAGAHSVYNNAGAFDGIGLEVISVSDTDMTLYSPGATEAYTDGYYHTFEWNGSLSGVSISGANTNGYIVYYQGWQWRFQDLKITRGASSYSILMYTAAGTLTMVNVELENKTFSSPSGAIRGYGGILNWYGGSITTTASGYDLFSNSHGAIIPTISNIFGVKMTDVIELADEGWDSTQDNFNLVRLINCEFGTTSPTLRPFTGGSKTSRFEIFNSDESTVTGGKAHRFWIEDGAGKVINNDSVYVKADDKINSSEDRFSYEITTQALCSKIHPLEFETIGTYMRLSKATEQKITFQLVTDTALTLTDTDIAIFANHANKDNHTNALWLTSGKTVGTGNYGTDPWAAGTALTISSLTAADWEGADPTSPNIYEIELDAVGLGHDCFMSFRVEIYKASIAAGTMFLSGQPRIS